MAEAGFTGFKRMAEAKRTIELVLPKLVSMARNQERRLLT
jgi:hypothetical protein